MEIAIRDPKKLAKIIAATDPLWVVTAWMKEHVRPTQPEEVTFRDLDKMTPQEIKDELLEIDVELYRRDLMEKDFKPQESSETKR
jgi:hypothetical protein